MSSTSTPSVVAGEGNSSDCSHVTCGRGLPVTIHSKVMVEFSCTLLLERGNGSKVIGTM